MKKKFYYGIALLVSIAIASTYVAKQEAKLPQILKANIEALAADEGGGIITIPCRPASIKCYFVVKDVEGNSRTGVAEDAEHI